ncbi:MAG: D-sedoheptulose 7-phosphate isomerase [Flavobacteriales bacterium]|nr:D-sedoheptulose 7-phosphate isomerase [Flavobacteriales bacterium]
MSLEKIDKELQEAARVLEEFMSDAANLQAIRKAANLLVNSVKLGGRIYSCGNGGSMSDAMHFAEELSGRFRDERKPIPAMAISDPGYISCAANDYGYEHVFSRFVEGFGKQYDALLAISTSGNSANVINAAKAAKEKGMHVIALTGKDGGELAKICDVEIRAPHSNYSDRIQEIHIKVIHILVMLIEQET